MTELVVDSVCAKGQLYPLLINFQNGYLNEDVEVDCAFLEDEEGNRTLATELSDLVYAGNEENEALGRTLILAKNRKTGKVRVIEVGCVELKPVSKVNLDASLQLDTSKLELSRKFGSKKAKQAMEQQEKLKVNVNTVTKQMEKASANITVGQLDLSEYDKNDSDDFYIPPIDRNATKVEEVYLIDKILSEDEYERIHSELQENDYKSDLHPYIKSFIKDRDLTPRQTVLAVYASELIKFSFAKATDVKKKNYVACENIQSLNDVIFKNFTQVSGLKVLLRTRPQPFKDKIICHVIVFLLILNNYKFPIEPLCAVLKTTPVTLATKARLVGATIANTGEKKMVQLKLPLPPKSAFGKRRKSSKF